MVLSLPRAQRDALHTAIVTDLTPSAANSQSA